MTDEQIIQLAEEFFFCNVSVMEYSARREDIIKFAQEMRKQTIDEIRRQKTGIGYVNDVLFVDEF